MGRKWCHCCRGLSLRNQDLDDKLVRPVVHHLVETRLRGVVGRIRHGQMGLVRVGDLDTNAHRRMEHAHKERIDRVSEVRSNQPRVAVTISTLDREQ